MRILNLFLLITLFCNNNSLIHKNRIIKSKNVINNNQLYMAGPGADYVPDDLPHLDYDKLPKIDSNMKES
jgi:hypothetical protein